MVDFDEMPTEACAMGAPGAAALNSGDHPKGHSVGWLYSGVVTEK